MEANTYTMISETNLDDFLSRCNGLSALGYRPTFNLIITTYQVGNKTKFKYVQQWVKGK
jgi:hypothetical protein